MLLCRFVEVAVSPGQAKMQRIETGEAMGPTWFLEDHLQETNMLGDMSMGRTRVGIELSPGDLMLAEPILGKRSDFPPTWPKKK